MWAAPSRMLLKDVGVFPQGELLGEVADHELVAGGEVPAVWLLDAGKDLEEARLAAAVAADQPDLVALVDSERCGVEDDLVSVGEIQTGGGDER